MSTGILRIRHRENIHVVNSLMLELSTRIAIRLPIGDQLRHLIRYMERCDEYDDSIAAPLRENPIWESFQRQYNDPTRKENGAYGKACTELYDYIVMALYHVGHSIYIVDDFHIRIKWNMVQKHYTIATYGTSNEPLSSVYTRENIKDVPEVIQLLLNAFTY